MDGPLKFLTARKILALLDLLAKFKRVLDLLAKFKRVLACSCSPNFCSCSHARFLVSIARDFLDPFLDLFKCNSLWCLIAINMAIKFRGSACDK